MKIVVSADQMMAADRHTIEVLGIASLTLMETAATKCFEVLIAETQAPCLITLVAGGGNNGGDGLALARLLALANYRVQVFTLKPMAAFRGDAAKNYQRLLAVGVSPKTIVHETDLIIADNTEWIVDAVLGTGLKGPVRGLTVKILEQLNKHPAPILAIDLPSGLSGNHGRVLGVHIQARITVTFQNFKKAHVVSPACLACGEVMVRDIGIKYPEVESLKTYLCEPADYGRSSRPLDSHKGRFGSLAILGGFSGMAGAANLAGMAALRFGAGKVRLFSDDPASCFRHDSLMVGHWKDIEPDDFSAWVIGPGLTRATTVFAELAKIDFGDRPVLWDADGLYFLKTQTKVSGYPWVMTPHPGEAGFLLDTSALTIQQDRLGALKALAEKYPGGWILLKGYRTLVRSPQGEVFIIGTGNPALATAGSGDVLAGMVGSLFAQGLPTDEAILMACLRHGLAADRWVRHHPDHSMLAEDIYDDLKFYP